MNSSSPKFTLYEPFAGETENNVLIPFTCSILTPLSKRALALAAKYFFSDSASVVEITIGSSTPVSYTHLTLPTT